MSPPSSRAEPPPFRPRFPWLNGDLQTLRDTLRGGAPDPGPFTRLWLDLPDGDALAAAWQAGQGRETVVLIHGLTGCEDGVHIRRAAAFWRGRGHGVLRLNLRGSAPSLPRSSKGYNAGAGQDIVEALRALPEELVAPGLVLIGVSLGGTQLLDALAREGDEPSLPLVAAATICAPVDLAATCARMMAPRNAVYHSWILRRMKQDAAALAPHIPPDRLEAARRARNVRAFDDGYVAPLAGYAGADDYYARCSLPPRIGRIRTPTLCLTAEDDPWIPAATYRAQDWRANPALTALIAPGGGHVGFHDGVRDGSWADRRIAAWLDTLR
ncbi:YheT family hydrolase [Elioraea rosea]|uniref:YheT family hydrolase n=1 Tax=Elioraea rosea TaxID=2492390 RepID=UPI00131574F5|nr:alpha/beta fold hydrolase [Elioraea rosea]